MNKEIEKLRDRNGIYLAYIGVLLMTIIFMMTFASASFQTTAHLEKIESDPHQNCYVTGINSFCCDAIPQKTNDDWQAELTAIPSTIDDGKGDMIINPDKNKGALPDDTKILYLKGNIIPYQKAAFTSVIDTTKKYCEIVDLNLLGSNEIKIGFNTNVFGVSGTPFEYFDVNSTSGSVHYNPKNVTWLNINGTSKYVSFTSMQNLVNMNFTISLWTKTFGPVAGYQIAGVDTQSSWLSWGNTTDYALPLIPCFHTIGATWSNNATCITSNLTFDTWYNLVAMYNGSVCSIYLNGILNSTASCTKYDFTGTTINIGGWLGAKTNWSVDELRVYNSSMSISFPLEIFNSGMKRNDSLNSTNLILYAPSNEYSGSIIHNLAGIRNGTITGATWQSDNINVTTLGYNVNISIINITAAKIVWDNGTIWNSTGTAPNNFTGNATFTFLNNQTIWIYENYVYSGTLTSLTINSPVNQTYNSNPTNLNFAVTGNANFSSCFFSFDNFVTNYSMTILNNTYSNYTFNNLHTGNYLANFSCNDTGGNINNNQWVNFSVHNVNYAYSIAEGYAFEMPVSSSYLPVGISYNVNDTNLSALSYVVYNVNGTVLQQNVSSNSSKLLNLNLTAYGQYYINITVNDTLNHWDSNILHFNLALVSGPGVPVQQQPQVTENQTTTQTQPASDNNLLMIGIIIFVVLLIIGAVKFMG